MIEVRDVVKTFDGFRALDNVNITVPKGAVYGLVGPNGSGKSTVIRHITGVYRQDSGTVRINGQDIFENIAVKQKMAYIPDDVFYFLQSNIMDMMKYYKGIYNNFDTERFEKMREVFRLDLKTPIRKFSKGMQKQAAFWLAISTRPEVLILDEPVDGLDPVMRRQIWSIIMGDVLENGTTVLISSHNLRELEDICDHVGIISHGKTLIERSLSELQENVCKVQTVLNDDGTMPQGLDILHEQQSGKIKTLIVRGRTEEISTKMEAAAPLFYDMVPLSLEEIFIYELGGEDYAVKDIVL